MNCCKYSTSFIMTYTLLSQEHRVQPTHTDNEDEMPAGETSLKNRSFVFPNILKAVVSEQSCNLWLSELGN